MKRNGVKFLMANDFKDVIGNPLNNKFKNSKGAYYLKGLFWELSSGEERPAVMYTLKDTDWPVTMPSGEELVLPSLKQLYLSCEDPTEYSFANKYLDGYQHWKRLLECNWFKPLIEEWREELDLKIRSKALLKVMQDAKSTSSRSSQISNRYLLEKGWDKDDRRGRPSKAKIKAEADKLFQEKDSIEHDWERLNTTDVSKGIN